MSTSHVVLTLKTSSGAADEKKRAEVAKIGEGIQDPNMRPPMISGIHSMYIHKVMIEPNGTHSLTASRKKLPHDTSSMPKARTIRDSMNDSYSLTATAAAIPPADQVGTAAQTGGQEPPAATKKL